MEDVAARLRAEMLNYDLLRIAMQLVRPKSIAVRDYLKNEPVTAGDALFDSSTRSVQEFSAN